MTTKLNYFIQRARSNPNHMHTSLMGLLFEVDGLRESFNSLEGRRAVGVDGVKKNDYDENLENNLADLSARLRRLGYRPQPARRVYIPKSGGGRRPLGVPCFEDKIVQDRIARILMGIWEPQFCNCSFGYRPGRNAHDALKEIDRIIFREKTQYVVEADIKGFFNAVSHEHMDKFLRHRINDPKFLRTIKRFLKSGVMEDGRFYASETGTPQGGLVSPVLSNIYLHYTLDLWFEKRFSRSCQGKAFLVRYCDDFLACFEKAEDAKRFYTELEHRLGKFGLEVAPNKTQILEFGSEQFGTNKKTTFTFLGFTHYVGTSRKGKFKLARKTNAKRIHTKLKAVKARLYSMRNQGAEEMRKYVTRHLNGHYQYYGISENFHSIQTYYRHCLKLLFKWLNRRSHKRSITWRKYGALLKKGYLPMPSIVHSFY